MSAHTRDAMIRAAIVDCRLVVQERALAARLKNEGWWGSADRFAREVRIRERNVRAVADLLMKV
jgi:hypothetical protein